MSNVSKSWISKFKEVPDIYQQSWFWRNFNWNTMSVWIGKFNQTNHLPKDITRFLDQLINNLRLYKLDDKIIVRFYHSHNVWYNRNEIDCFIISDSNILPSDYNSSLLGIMFEVYQITEDILNTDNDFHRLLDHYLMWNGFYGNSNLIDKFDL